MSQEKLQAFAEAVSKSAELQKRFASIQAEAARSTAEKLAKLSESAGAPFTVEEYLNSVGESSEEMSAEQLHSVAGGVWAPTKDNILASIFTFGIKCAVEAITSAVHGDVDSCQIKRPGGWD